MKERSSNLEILRIVAMLIIIAHHYVVNSGIVQLYDYSNITANMIFLQFFGFGGKMAINIFVLISSYFMCQYKLTWKKVLKLYLEVKFYAIVIYIIFVITGYDVLSLRRIVRVLFNMIYGVNVSFMGSFLAFYLLVPFLNRMRSALSRKMHLELCGVLLFIYTIISTFSIMNDTWNYIGWYVTLYFVASYIRIYSNRYTQNVKYGIIIMVGSLILIFASILCVDFVGYKIAGFEQPYYMVVDSNKLLALTCAMGFFLTFKNIKIRNNKYVNMVSASTFGIFLIHTQGRAMTRFLWQTVFDNCKYYDSKWLSLHAVLSVFCVFLVCMIIDMLRKRFLEKPIMNKLSKIESLNKECFAERKQN